MATKKNTITRDKIVSMYMNYRLENTVYQFEEGDILKFTDFENQTIVQKEVKIELDENMLLIHEEKGDRLAKIIEFSDEKN